MFASNRRTIVVLSKFPAILCGARLGSSKILLIVGSKIFGNPKDSILKKPCREFAWDWGRYKVRLELIKAPSALLPLYAWSPETVIYIWTQVTSRMLLRRVICLQRWSNDMFSQAFKIIEILLTNALSSVSSGQAAVSDHSQSLPSLWTHTVVALLHVLTLSARVTVVEAQLTFVQVWGQREGNSRIIEMGRGD